MFTDLVDQVRTRGLPQVGNAAAEQGKLGALQLRQVERERDLTLEPWLDSVAVGGSNVNRICARPGCDMQVVELAVNLVLTEILPPDVSGNRSRNQQEGKSSGR